MFTVESEVRIAQPVGVVYGFLADPGNYPRWIADVRRVEAPNPLAPGAAFREVTVFGGQEKTSLGEVAEMVPDARLVLRVVRVLDGPGLLPTRTFTLRPDGGGTRLRWRSEVRTRGLMRLLEPLPPGVFRGRKAGVLEALRAALEEPGRSAG